MRVARFSVLQLNRDNAEEARELTDELGGRKKRFREGKGSSPSSSKDARPTRFALHFRRADRIEIKSGSLRLLKERSLSTRTPRNKLCYTLQ